MKLNEGLREKDLEGLVLPIISIDQYESKIDDDSIVVAFYVREVEPAEDLNRFIQKSAISIIDTEVSPAPNDEGNYLVFVEIDRDDEFGEKIFTIINEISNLVMIEPDEWKFTCYGHEGKFALNEKNVHVLIRTMSIEELRRQEVSESVYRFFEPSILESFEFDVHTGRFVMSRGKTEISGRVVNFGTSEELDEAFTQLPISLTEEANRYCRIWESILGASWVANLIGEYVMLSNIASPNILIVDPR